jgi:hypothetical protein
VALVGPDTDAADDVVFFDKPYMHQWFANSHTEQTSSNREQVLGMLSIDVGSSNTKSLQAKLTQVLNKALFPDIGPILCRSFVCVGLPNIDPGCFIANAKALNKLLPTCVLIDLLRLWTNGWITRKRFGDGESVCALCQYEGTVVDDVVRILECNITLSMSLLFSCKLTEMDQEAFLSVGQVSEQLFLLQAAFLSTIRHLHSYLRYHRTDDFEAMKDIVKVRKKFLAS